MRTMTILATAALLVPSALAAQGQGSGAETRVQAVMDAAPLRASLNSSLHAALSASLRTLLAASLRYPLSASYAHPLFPIPFVRVFFAARLRAHSSAVEHYLDMVGVRGSIPRAPTTIPAPGSS